MPSLADLIDAAAVVDFTMRIIRIPSPSRQEARVAHAVAAEMQALGYDEVTVDEMYNVKGTIFGAGSGPTLLFNGHIDHAEVGSMADPHAAIEMDGGRFGTEGQVIYGRAACDMKAGVAGMVYAAAAAKRGDRRPRGTVIVTCDVREEEGTGEGIIYMLERGLKADLAVSGEASKLNVYLGHRGKTEWRFRFHGRTAHASMPDRGVNALLQMNGFLNVLRDHYETPTHPFLGRGTYAPIDAIVKPGHLTPILPDLCELFVDRRYTSDESPETLEQGWARMIDLARAADPEFSVEFENTKVFPPLYCAPEQPIVQALQGARTKVMGAPSEPGAWLFAVNGSFIQQAGIPCAGFGPGDERFAHTPDDHVPVADIVTAARVYAQLIEDLCG